MFKPATAAQIQALNKVTSSQAGAASSPAPDAKNSPPNAVSAPTQGPTTAPAFLLDPVTSTPPVQVEHTSTAVLHLTSLPAQPFYPWFPLIGSGIFLLLAIALFVLGALNSFGNSAIGRHVKFISILLLFVGLSLLVYFVVDK